MISKSEIEDLLLSIKPIFEPTTLEFKKATEFSKKMLETVSAFANTDGGDIVLGLHQDRKANYRLTYFGIEKPQEMEDRIKDFIRNDMVNIDESGYQVSIENFSSHERPLIILHIDKVDDDLKKPVFIKERGKTPGSFIRVGQSDTKMPHYMQEQITRKQMRIKGELPETELTVVSDASLPDIDMMLLKQYAVNLNDKKIQVKIDDNIQAVQNFLRAKNIITKDGLPTIFGLVCFGKTPETFLRYKSMVHLVDERNIDIVSGDRGKNTKLIGGTIDSLFDESLDWISQNITKSRVVDSRGNTTEEVEYPLPIIRELIANALIHRDYEQGDKSFIKIKDKSIEIRNPGLINDHIYKGEFIVPGIVRHPNDHIARYALVTKIAEGQGKGLSSLLLAALDDIIDMPEIKIDFNGIVTFILNKGSLLDRSIENILKMKATKIKVKLTNEQKLILAYLIKSEKKRRDGSYVVNLTEEYLNDKLKTALHDLQKFGILNIRNYQSTKIYELPSFFLEDDYSEELRNIYGAEHESLPTLDIKILNLVFEATESEENLSSRRMTELIYPEINVGSSSFHDDYYRKIKQRCNVLANKGFIKKDPRFTSTGSPKGGYVINKDFVIVTEKKVILPRISKEELYRQGKLF